MHSRVSHQGNNLQLPLYDANVKIDPSMITEHSLSRIKEKFEVMQQQQILNSEFITLKTTYFKMKDIYKMSKFTEETIPNPPVELSLTPLSEFQHQIANLQLAVIPEWQLTELAKGTPIMQFPEQLYDFDHPYDSNEQFRSKAGPKWQHTLRTIEKRLLPISLNKIPSDELYKIITDIHILLVGNADKPRNEFIFVCDPRKFELSYESIEKYFESIKNYLLKLENGELLHKRISRLEQKILRWQSIENASPYITPKEWDAMQKAVFLPVAPVGLEEKAKIFLEHASELINAEEYHPYQIAAFLHYGLANLHLFTDTNGRLARTVANIYLMQNGFEPFFVAEDAEYTELYQKKTYDVHFCHYLLQNKIKMQTCKIEEDNTDVECRQM